MLQTCTKNKLQPWSIFSCYISGSVKVPQSNKTSTQEDFEKNIRYTNLWTNVMLKTFRDFKQVYLHAHCTSTLAFWWPYKKWWYIVNIIDMIIYTWCCTWTFVWWRFNEMNNKCWNNIFIEKLYPFLNSLY